MGFITPYLFIDAVLVVVSVVYVYFRWSFGHWKRRGLPYLEPSFPFGTMDDPFRRKRTIGNNNQKCCNIPNVTNKSIQIIFLNVVQTSRESIKITHNLEIVINTRLEIIFSCNSLPSVDS